MKPVFVTFIYGDDSYVKLGTKLLNKFKEHNYETFVYTEKINMFHGHNVIPYLEAEFSYHHKFFIIETLYKLGHKQIIMLDADLIIFDETFFKELGLANFSDGISYTRSGTPQNLKELIELKKLDQYENLLKDYGVTHLNEIESIWEDIVYFNFDNINPTDFFKHYRELMGIKHIVDQNRKSGERFGDQEGYAVSIAAKLSNIPLQINNNLKDNLSNLRASNYTYDSRLKPILSELDIIIPYRKDSEDRKENLIKTLNYYKRHFNNSGFIVSEQGVNQTVEVGDFDYIFRKKDLPHNQSQCINDGVLLSKKKYVCVVDCDIILLNYYNIYLALKEMFMGDIDYCLPYVDCFNLPNFDLREPWGGKCVGGIFIIDKEKFIEAGMNDEGFFGWGREDDERHHRLIEKGLRFKRISGHIVHMAHPDQQQIAKTAEDNLNRLKEVTNDNSYINKI